MDKARVTLLVGCSAEGELLSLLCIGKVKNPCGPAGLRRKQSAPIPTTTLQRGE